MTSRFEHHIDLASAPEQVFDVLTDPQLLVARYEASGSTDVEVIEQRADGDGLVMVHRRVEAGALPAPIARLVRGAAQVTQTDRWSPGTADGHRRADWTVATAGVAVDIAGTIELAPRGDGTRLTEAGVVTARVRIVGALIERLAIEQSGSKLRREWDWLAAQL